MRHHDLLTGNPFVGIFLIFISTVLQHSVLRDWLHLDPRSMGKHPQVLKEALPMAKQKHTDTHPHHTHKLIRKKGNGQPVKG